MSHRHAVALRRQKISRKEVFCFQVFTLRKMRPRAEIRRKHICQFAYGIVLSDLSSKICREEKLQPVVSSQRGKCEKNGLARSSAVTRKNAFNVAGDCR